MPSPISITKKEIYIVVGLLILVLVVGKYIGAQASSQ
jgi:hypothetical protein